MLVWAIVGVLAGSLVRSYFKYVRATDALLSMMLSDIELLGRGQVNTQRHFEAWLRWQAGDKRMLEEMLTEHKQKAYKARQVGKA